jgi:DNA-binding Xre family transcriptional regulator
MSVQNRLNDLLEEKMAREQRTISVAEVARAGGMKRQSVYKWFNNQIQCFPAKTLDAFCRYFECEVGDLIVMRRDQLS